MKTLGLFFKKQYAAEEKIQRLLRKLEDMMNLYQGAYEAYLVVNEEVFNKRSEELGQLEKELDDLGLQIQMSLVHESLMPDSRDDLLWLLTKLDKIPSRLKHSLGDIALEKPVIPETFHTPLKNLLDHSRRAVQALAQAMDALFSDLRAVRQYVEEVSRQESEVDQIEHRLMLLVFNDKSMDLARQYQLKGILKELGGITNLAEDVGDAVHILATIDGALVTAVGSAVATVGDALGLAVRQMCV